MMITRMECGNTGRSRWPMGGMDCMQRDIKGRQLSKTRLTYPLFLLVFPNLQDISRATAMTSIQEAKDYISQLSTGTVSGEIPKFAIITGGTTGIGPSIALSLARIGCRRIVIVGRNATAGEIVLDQMREENNFGEYSMIQGDLS